MGKFNSTFNGKVVRGSLKPNDPLTFSVWLGVLEGEEVEITVKKKKNRRSLNQNAYYWVLVDILGEYIGYFKDEMHDVLKNKFANYIDKNGFERTLSTAKMKSDRMTKYIEDIKAWAAIEYKKELPDPESILQWMEEVT